MNYVDYALDLEELQYLLFLLDDSIDALKDCLSSDDLDEELTKACRKEIRVARSLRAKLNPDNLRLTLDKEKDIPPKVYTS